MHAAELELVAAEQAAAEETPGADAIAGRAAGVAEDAEAGRTAVAEADGLLRPRSSAC